MKTSICKIFALFFFMLYSFTTKAQYQSIDSLKKVVQSQKEDTNKVNTFNAISLAYWQKDNYENAMQNAQNALSLSKTINFKKGEGDSYFWMGMAYGIKQNPEQLRYHLNALKIYEEIDNKKSMAECYEGIIANYMFQDKYAEALKYTYTLLSLKEKIADKKGIADNLSFIGIIYSRQNNESEALKNYLASLRLREQINDKEGIAQSYLTIGDVYLNQSNFSESLKKYLAALKIFEGPGIESKWWGVPASLRSIGTVFEKQGDAALSKGEKTNAENRFREANEKYLTSLKLFEKLKDKTSVALCFTKLGDINTKLKNFTAAKSYFEKSIELYKLIKSKSGLMENYSSLSTLDSIQGNYGQAYQNYRRHILYRDSLVDEESTKTSVQAKMQYEFDKKEAVSKAVQEKKDADSKRIRNLQYSAIGFFLLIAAFLYLSNSQKQKAKTKVEKAYKELKSTQSQLIQAEKMASLGELTVGIAHEIQNPLNFVNNFSEVNQELLTELVDEANRGNTEEIKAIANDIKENSEKINHHGKRADAIVKGMLQHSRTGNATKEPTDINKLADEYLRLAYHGLRAKDKSFNATIKTDFDETIGQINIVPQDIGRVILNLITNAFYTVTEKKEQKPEGYEPTVAVSSKKMDDKVLISIKDNGIGIPQKILDKIFQPFFTTKSAGEGTGLGLSLAYDIVKAHGGELKVETKEGEGSQFIIKIPVV